MPRPRRVGEGARRASRTPLVASFRGQTELSLDAHGDAHPAADAQRRQSLLRIAARHFVQQRDQHARARGADRMADRDRAAVDVDDVGVPAEVLVDRQRLRGESLVGLDEFEVFDLPAGFLQRLARGRDGACLLYTSPSPRDS